MEYILAIYIDIDIFFLENCCQISNTQWKMIVFLIQIMDYE
ncbi:MAG: hypothetical protein WC593_12070 [Methanoregula sp.]